MHEIHLLLPMTCQLSRWQHSMGVSLQHVKSICSMSHRSSLIFTRSIIHFSLTRNKSSVFDF